MGVEFLDLTDYFFHPPSLEQLQGRVQDRRRKAHGDTLFIIPSYKDGRRLGAMLAELSKQSYMGFDVAVIYAKGDRFVENRRLSILHIERKMDLGFAGAAYLGQLAALRGGYKYHVIATANMLPYSRKSLGILHEAAESEGADYVNGKFAYAGAQYPGGHIRRTKIEECGIRWAALWSMIRTDAVRKIGLYPLPMYSGGDDCEYGFRLSGRGMRRAYPDEIIFTKVMRLQTMWGFVRNGGMDSTYLYPALFGARWMPEITMANSQKNAAGDWAQFLFTTLPIIIATDMKIRLLRDRMAGFDQYCENVRRRRFVVPCFAKPKGEVDITKFFGSRKKADGENLMQHNLAGTPNFVAHFSNSPRATGKGFYMALNDNFCVANHEGKLEYLVSWKRKIPIYKKAVYVALSVLEGIAVAASMALRTAFRKHIFDGYGLEVVKKLGADDRS